MNTTLITELTTNIKSIFTETDTILNTWKIGEKKGTKLLTEDVCSNLKLNVEESVPFVRYFTHELAKTDFCHIIPGKHGGVVRGPRPVKVEKMPKSILKEKVNAASVNIDAMIEELAETVNVSDEEMLEEVING